MWKLKCFLPVGLSLRLIVLYPKFLQAYQPVGPARAGPAKSDGTVLTSSWPLPSTKPWTHRKEPLHEYRIPRSISCVLPQSPLRPPLSHGLPHGVGSVLLPYISPWSPNSWISNPAVRITSCVLGPGTALCQVRFQADGHVTTYFLGGVVRMKRML